MATLLRAWNGTWNYKPIRAATGDGCQWTLAVSGNTAELMPVPQTCKTGNTTAFWAMTSDAHHVAAVMSGLAPISGALCNFLLATGKLTKHGGL